MVQMIRPSMIFLIPFLLFQCFDSLSGENNVCTKMEKVLSALDVVKKFLQNTQNLGIENDGVAASSKISDCDRHEIAAAYLDLSTEWISDVSRSCVTYSESKQQELTYNPKDCSDILENGNSVSGVYTIWPDNTFMDNKPFRVYCDMNTDGGGWTVIQRRGNFSSKPISFYRDWKSYKYGFGSLEKEFWLGNEKIYTLINQDYHDYEIRFDLKDMDGNSSFALYRTFSIDDEDSGYKLHIGNYSGDAGDSMAYHTDNMFTTKDKDNDGFPENCAHVRFGGWWYKGCTESNLNGLHPPPSREDNRSGIFWLSWKGYASLAGSEIKLRRL